MQQTDRRRSPRPIETLKKRADFLRVRGGKRASMVGFLLERKSRVFPEGGPRFGFTITKKIGNAVVRNRIRRRLRAALSAMSADLAQDDNDYVLVARLPAATQNFAALLADLEAAFAKVKSTSRPRNPPAIPVRRKDPLPPKV